VTTRPGSGHEPGSGSALIWRSQHDAGARQTAGLGQGPGLEAYLPALLSYNRGHASRADAAARTGKPSMTKGDAKPQSFQVALSKLEPATTDAGSPSVGIDACFEAYQRELNYLLASLRRLGVRGADIEDVVHEVFLVMHRRWQDYDQQRPLRPWLFGIAFRVAASQRRRGTREVLGESDDAEARGPLPDDAAAAGETRVLLLKALAHLPLERRAVLVMHDVDDMPMREIAEQLALPLFTAYSRLRKARKELDAALQRLQKTRRR